MMSNIDNNTAMDESTPQDMTPATSLNSSGKMLVRQDAKELKILKSIMVKKTEPDKINYMLKNAEFNRDIRRQFNRYKREMRERIKRQQEEEADLLLHKHKQQLQLSQEFAKNIHFNEQPHRPEAASLDNSIEYITGDDICEHQSTEKIIDGAVNISQSAMMAFIDQTDIHTTMTSEVAYGATPSTLEQSRANIVKDSQIVSGNIQINGSYSVSKLGTQMAMVEAAKSNMSMS